MSWLLGRTRRAFSGWHDDFGRTEPSLLKPWAVWGSTPCTASMSGGHLVFGPGNTIADFGGWSFEHAALTTHWVSEFQMAAVRNGAVAEIFRVIINKPPWSRVGTADFSRILALDIQYRTSGINSRIMINTYDGAGSVGNTLAESTIPQGTFDGSYHTFKILIDVDSYLRVYLDGTFYLAVVIPSAYRPTVGNRALNFMNQMGTSVSLNPPFKLGDQSPDPPWAARAWSPAYTDTFNRSDGPVANGWTEIGSNDRARIVSNSYSFNGGTDGSRAIIRDTGSTTGRQRITAVIGGNNGPSGQDASLVVRCNAAGTSAIAANVYNNRIYLSRLTSSMGVDGEPGMSDFANVGVTVNSGDLITLAASDGWAWVEQNGQVVVVAGPGIDTVVPTSQTYAGARVERHSFTNSASWNELDLFAA